MSMRTRACVCKKLCPQNLFALNMAKLAKCRNSTNTFWSKVNQVIYSSSPIGLGAKLRYVGYFSSLLHPREETFGYYPELGTCLGGLETHVVLSYLWSVFCKSLVINVTLKTLTNKVYEIQD